LRTQIVPPRRYAGGSAGSSPLSKGANDAAIFADIDPDLRSRVFQAAKNSANGKSTPQDAALKDEITAMLEADELEPSVAAALLRTCNQAPEPETNFGTLSPNLSTRSDGESDAPTRYYNPFGPAGGGYKGAGDRRFMNLLKGYLDSHGIGRRSSPARATAPALDLLRGLEAQGRRRRRKGFAG
jgi:hypothetical protein